MQCISNNVFGINIAELAITANVKHFILVSTDKAVNPTNFRERQKACRNYLSNLINSKRDPVLQSSGLEMS